MVSNSKPGVSQALATSCFPGFPGGRTRRWCWAPSLLLPHADQCTHVLWLPLLLEGQPSYEGIFIVLSGVQGLLLVFSQCSVRTVASIDVFLMHLWREMNSTSTYSSAILNISLKIFLKNIFKVQVILTKTKECCMCI